MTVQFIHLRTHTTYSLLQGAMEIDDLIKKCAAEHMRAVGIADFGNLFGSLEFSVAAQAQKIQPIVGCVFKFDAELDGANGVLDEIFLIAKNERGYSNLLELASLYYTSGRKSIQLSMLAQFTEGIIALTAMQEGTLGRLILAGNLAEADAFCAKLNHLFKDNLYIELSRHGLPQEQQIEPYLIDLGVKYNVPFVATNRVYFLEKQTFEAHDALLAIAQGSTISADNRSSSNPEYYFKSAQEMGELFADVPEAITNTAVIARRCSVMPLKRNVLFPKFEIESGLSEDEELERLSRLGLEEHLQHVKVPHEPYWERLAYELGVIKSMRFSSYFLIVSDFIRWAKSQGIPVGPGRGSGVGSVVSWSMNICDVDPIHFGLLFERFLNPERISLPDLDIDFCKDRREEVLEYVRTKYGRDRVAHIITFGKLQARAVIRDVGRVLEMPYSAVDSIAKLVPFNAINPVSLQQAIDMEPEFARAMSADERVAKLIAISLQLEGLNRHASTHATGVVIADRPLVELVPMYQEAGVTAIQYSMKWAEAAGLIKFDFLGLRTLSVINECRNLVVAQVDPHFSLATIAFDDAKTFAMLSAGQSIGVFQFESGGMRASLMKLKPDHIEDVIALGALYRPGPMENLQQYINCKHGRVAVEYIHPDLKDLLSKTFGIIIYQEQVIEIAKILAGYSRGEADLLRKAMGKKIREEMEAQRHKFVSGAAQRGLESERAGFIFDLLAKFAGYGFNRSHAVAYGIISYQTAYLKANYPAQMMAALMNGELNDTDQLNTFVFEARAMGVCVKSPCINRSWPRFVVEEGEVLYALGAIKTIGFDAIEAVCKNREERGKFLNVFDLFRRVQLNKRQFEHLIKAGALDCLSKNRKQLIDSLDLLMKSGQGDASQLSFFTDHVQLVETADWTHMDRLDFERDGIGFYLSDHPLNQYRLAFEKLSVRDAAFIANELPSGSFRMQIAAVTVAVRNRSSANGRYIAADVSTPSGMLEIFLSGNDVLESARTLLYSAKPIVMDAQVRKDEGSWRITVLAMRLLSEFMDKKPLSFDLRIESEDELDALRSALVKCGPGQVPHGIRVAVKADKAEALMQIKGYRVRFESECLAKLLS